MITQEQANDFANEWIAAWNSHDIDKILMHYDDKEIVFLSPFVRLLHNPSGSLENKEALRDYFSKGLEAYPNLHFELYHVLVGVNSITLVYRSVRRNLLAAEVMEINAAGKIIKAMAHYTEQ